MNPSVLVASFLAFADKLKFKNLFLMVIILFLVNLVIPDFIPFIDEIILGLLAIILAQLKKERENKKEGNLIEGEVVNQDDEKSK